jgi:hypothetical protein
LRITTTCRQNTWCFCTNRRNSYVSCEASEATSLVPRTARFCPAMQTRSKRAMASVWLLLCQKLMLPCRND